MKEYLVKYFHGLDSHSRLFEAKSDDAAKKEARKIVEQETKETGKHFLIKFVCRVIELHDS